MIWDSKTQKNVRVAQQEVPSWVKDSATAEEFFRTKRADYDTARRRLEKTQEWKTKFYDFVELVDRFIAERKKNAPRSWEGDLFWLENYVMPFFLKQPGGNNINNWPEHFEAFKDHLQVVETIKARNTRLSYNSMNHCIKALNRFLAELIRTRVCSPLPLLAAFNKKLCRKIELSDIYKPGEIEKVYSKLLTINQDAADFFIYLSQTGQRMGEGLGTSLESLKQGLPANRELQRWLEEYGITCYGYIYLSSQLDRKSRADELIRSPLKARPSISARFVRIIPIEDKEVFNMLVRRWKDAEDRWDGKAPRDYQLLWPTLSRGKFAKILERACREAKIPYKSPHMLRHAYATQLCGRIGGHNSLVQTILGHSDIKITENYIHLQEQMMEEIQASKAGENIDFVK